MKHFEIRNWSQLQHYKERTAPWIKLYRELIDSQMWIMSSDASKLLAICLMMLALRTDNKIPANPEYIKRYAHLEVTPDFSELLNYGFIEYIDDSEASLQPASTILATCPTERESESESESESEVKQKPEKKLTAAAELASLGVDSAIAED